MASKKVEDIHVIMLNKLLSESGLECTRTIEESVEATSSSGESDDLGSQIIEEESKPEATQEEEEKAPETEVIPEEMPYVFPSPSLRRILPDRIRKFEEQNRIHVLPEQFKTDIDPALIPKIAITPSQKYIDTLAELVGCSMYRSSLPEYWFLDTMAYLLRRAQEDELNRPTQAVLMLWFCEWMKEMQHFDAADRQRMLRRFQDNMLATAKFIAVENRIPTPAEAGVDYVAHELPPDSENAGSPTSPDSRQVTFEGAAYQCSLMDLVRIIHYIFDLFSTDYQYNLVRSVFTFTPGYQLIDTPYQLQNPKRLFAPLKPMKEKKSPKKDAKPPAKGKKKEVDTEEFLALMELKSREERELEAKEELDREEWHRRQHVLPLSAAADDALFDKYWPPPPEPEPEPQPEVKPKGKGKK